MFRTLLIVTLILLAIPLFNSAKDYIQEKADETRTKSNTAVKFFKYGGGR